MKYRRRRGERAAGEGSDDAMGKPSGRELLALLREFVIGAVPETWLVWTDEERRAVASLHNKIARFVGDVELDTWIQSLAESTAPDDEE